MFTISQDLSEKCYNVPVIIDFLFTWKRSHELFSNFDDRLSTSSSFIMKVSL